MVSNVTGTWLSDDEATSPDYWLRHLRQPVLFSDGLGTLLRTTHRQLLEVGPEATLTSLARPIVKDQGGATPMASLGPWQEGSSSRRGLLAALAELWQSGVEPAWPKLAAAGRRSKISLPTYPFERRSYGRPAPMSAVSAINVPTALAPTAPDAAVPVLEFPIGPPRAVQVPGHASPEPPAAGLETLIYRQLEVIEAQLETLSAVGRRGAEAGGSPLV
jgi:acyl transferase domain-containing protein